jgi:lysozyme
MNAPPQVSTGAKAGGLVAVIGAAAAALLVPHLDQWEGNELTPYQDVIKVWTNCRGNTKNVDPKKVMTEGECAVINEQQLIAHAKPVMQCVPGLRGRPNQIAASVSLAYNVGPGGWIGVAAERKLKPDAALDGWRGGFCGSTAAVRFRANQWRAGCDAFLAWNKSGGRVWRGLTNRRKSERNICLRDL